MNGYPSGSVVVVVMMIIEGRMFSVSVNLDSRGTNTLFDDAQKVEGTRQEYNSRP